MMPLLQKSKTAARDWLQGIDTALLRTVAAAAALCMLLAHGFAFTNLFPNHDSTVLVFDAQWTMYVLGRWAQNLYFPLVRGKIAAPWLIGAFSIVYLALTSYCITSLLHLKKWSAALLTGLLGTCASVTAQLATYTYEPGTTPVAFVGSFTDSQLAYHDPAFSRYEEGDLHQVNSAVTYDGTIKWWFQHVMGSNAAVIADSGTLIALGETPAVQAMPLYPANGYCAMVDGTAVIKLSD